MARGDNSFNNTIKKLQKSYYQLKTSLENMTYIKYLGMEFGGLGDIKTLGQIVT